MLLTLRGLLVIAICRVIAATPALIRPATYDQRQTGDLNVQIALKDLRIVALLDSELLDDYTDYDYFYDYSDFTIKPGGNRPTTSPTTSSTTEKDDITGVSEPLSPLNSTASTTFGNINSTEHSTLSNDEKIPNANPSNGIANLTSIMDNDKSQSSEENEEPEAIVASSAMMKSALRSQKRCKSGYTPNGNGRCRRVSRPWLSLLP
ncbi:hypothetical protein EAG_13433 [Camponotus floridanus]|uniref:Uncharacterized protein n=1 Tax=Camponotus floridanus TaxID=104421 RepID=E2A226_CAMFO|nr:uncharacterized protein LOC105259462 isoform X1 [Camponotus floridanus]EFN72510.1 hypothetical protein EAG_13433 [Camponotus floridanus]